MFKTLDNIDDKILDELKEKYSDKKGFRIIDNRTSIPNGKERGYFLISKDSTLIKDELDYEFTFIWIGKNLWQYRYLNIHCNKEPNWISPVELLNKLLEVE